MLLLFELKWVVRMLNYFIYVYHSSFTNLRHKLRPLNQIFRYQLLTKHYMFVRRKQNSSNLDKLLTKMYDYNYDYTFLRCVRFLNNPQKGSSSSFDNSTKKGIDYKNQRN